MPRRAVVSSLANKLDVPDNLAIVEVDVSDKDMLDRIGRLRVVAWESEIPGGVSRGSWIDEGDLVARHWAYVVGGEPVASARLSVHARIEDVPASVDFLGLFSEALPAPIASINRLVVAPHYRGRGLSRQLDEVRLQAAEEMGSRCVVGSTPSPRRQAQLISLGFVLKGSTGHPNVSEILRDLPPSSALFRLLPRGGRSTC